MIKSNKSKLRFLAIALTIFLITNLLIPLSVFAEGTNTPKEEVIYVNLNPDGSVKEIDVVNIVELTQDGKITDYGDYQNLRNMTTTDPINYTEDTINIEAKSGKIYYEGKLNKNIIPWNIHLSYQLNGQDITPDKLAGKSGALTIQMDVSKNENCHDNFFNSYALQTNFTFNTENFKNITAEDATIANVGKNKQLTYTILPGKGINTTINADTNNFSMDPVTINAIPLNLDIEVDESELTDEVSRLFNAITKLDNGTGSLKDGIDKLENSTQGELKSGVNELDNGAVKLQNGMNTLTSGGKQLNTGTSDVKNGASQLDSGINSLNDGINQVQTALDTLNSQSSTLVNGSSQFKKALDQLQSALNDVSASTEELTKLTDASTQIKLGIDQLVTSSEELQAAVSSDGLKNVLNQNGLNLDELQAKNVQTVQSIQNQIEQLKQQIEQLKKTGTDTSALEAQISQLSQIVQLIGANNTVIDGTKTYLDTVNQNISKLTEGAKTLQASYSEFDLAIQNLVNTLSDLLNNVTELKEAVNTLVSEYSKIDNGINEYTTAVSQILSGYGAVTNGSQQLVNGSKSLKAGTESLYVGSNQLLSGLSEANNSMNKFTQGTKTLGNGVNSLNSGVSKLEAGANTLKNGTLTLKNETNGIDKKIDNKIDEMIKSISGEDIQLQSFVSEKNTNIKSVQFVLKTDEIKAPDKDNTLTTAEPKLNFWQKFLKLFGLYQDN